MQTIIEFVTEHTVVTVKELLIRFSCPHTYGHDHGYAWGRPAYCNGSRPRNGENFLRSDGVGRSGNRPRVKRGVSGRKRKKACGNFPY